MYDNMAHKLAVCASKVYIYIYTFNESKTTEFLKTMLDTYISNIYIVFSHVKQNGFINHR